jgi:hypothetical protein
MKEMVEKILALAAQLPTGLTDARALEKYHRERQELTEALADNDLIGAYMEAADCCYYLIKARHNHLIGDGTRDHYISVAAGAVGLNLSQVLQICETKYSLRAGSGNPKDDAEERRAVVNLLKGW